MSANGSKKLHNKIKVEAIKQNIDNISRTLAYQRFYQKNPEIGWAYLASMVSRNAGWSMTDLINGSIVQLISKEWRRRLFMTFERVNWLIFSDAYPQLLIYEQSKQLGKPLFNELYKFNVSNWIIQEWWHFWYEKDGGRLMNALIINEQNIIEKPVIKAPFFDNRVFSKPVYEWQERLHFSIVMFPSIDEQLYGSAVVHFTDVKKRIELGKKLAWILFESPKKENIYSYQMANSYTGNRCIDIPWIKGGVDQQYFPLRMIYPIVYHEDERRDDWSFDYSGNLDKLLVREIKPPSSYVLTQWYKKKQERIDKTANFFHDRNLQSVTK